MTACVTYRLDRHVAYIGLNRPEKLNAISPDLLADYDRVLTEFIADPDARVAVLYGEGRAFCVGMDLTGGHGYGGAEDIAADRTRIEQMTRGWLRLWDCPKPIIAQVHGYCIAGGTQIAACCDIVSIADDTTFGWPKVPIGAGFISPMWAYRVGVQRAKLMSFRVGSTMTAQEVYDAGFATLMFPPDELAERTREIAEDIAKLPSDMLRIKKYANNRILEHQGFRESILAGAEWDAIAHATESVRTARAWIREYGLKGAIAKFQAEGM